MYKPKNRKRADSMEMGNQITVGQNSQLTIQEKYGNNLTGDALLAKSYEKPVYNNERDELIKLKGNTAVYRKGEIEFTGSKPPLAISGEQLNRIKGLLLSREVPSFIGINGAVIASRTIRSVTPKTYTKEKRAEELDEELKGYTEVKNIEELQTGKE